MTRPALRRSTRLTDLVDVERTLVHDDARGVYLFTARRTVRQPTREQIAVWARYEQLRNYPEARVLVAEIRETLLQRLARLRRRLAARKAAARAAMTPRLETLSS